MIEVDSGRDVRLSLGHFLTVEAACGALRLWVRVLRTHPDPWDARDEMRRLLGLPPLLPRWVRRRCGQCHAAGSDGRRCQHRGDDMYMSHVRIGGQVTSFGPFATPEEAHAAAAAYVGTL